MDDTQFWTFIGDAAVAAEDCTARVAHLRMRLGDAGPAEIDSFVRIQTALMDAAYTWDLWGAAYVINVGCSADSFDHFRGWLLLQGRQTWEKTLADAESLAEFVKPGVQTLCAEMLNVARDVFEAKTGMPVDVATVAPRLPSGPSWDEAELPARYPRLWAIFAEANRPEAALRSKMSMAMALLGRREYEPAAGLFAEVRAEAARPPQRALATNNLAWARLLQESPQGWRTALDLADDALKILAGDPDETLYRDNLLGTRALALVMNGRDAEGADAVIAVLRGQSGAPLPTTASRLCILALALAHLGHADQAGEFTARAAGIDPQCALLPRVQAALSKGP